MIRGLSLLAPSSTEFDSKLTLSDGQQAAIREPFALCRGTFSNISQKSVATNVCWYLIFRAHGTGRLGKRWRNSRCVKTRLKICQISSDNKSTFLRCASLHGFLTINSLYIYIINVKAQWHLALSAKMTANSNYDITFAPPCITIYNLFYISHERFK